MNKGLPSAASTQSAQQPARIDLPSQTQEIAVLLAATQSREGAGLHDGAGLASSRHVGRLYRLHRVIPDSAQDIETLLREPGVRLLLVDVRLCDTLGLAALRQIQRCHQDTSWLLVWQKPEPRWIEPTIQLEAVGAVEWDIDAWSLAHAADAVLGGDMWFPRSVMQSLYVSLRDAMRGADIPASIADNTRRALKLTEREDQVLTLMRNGLTNRQIAERLAISINTVKKHLASVFAKRGLRNRRQGLALE